MKQPPKIAKWEYLILTAVLGLAFYVAFIPHISYPYPVHIDDWIHMVIAKAIMQAGDTTITDPFIGNYTISMFSANPNLEVGFQLFLGVFQRISDIPWEVLFRFMPSVIYMLTALSVYVMARRQGFGWESAFFASLIPTTVGILGPAFLVPVAMGLLFIPLALFVAFNFRGWWSYLVLLLFSAFLLSIHAPSAISLGIVMIPFILLNLKGDFKHSLGIFLAVLLPFLVPFPWIFHLLVPTARALFTPVEPSPYVALPVIIRSLGNLPIILSLIGVVVLVIKGQKKNYSLVLGLLLLLLVLTVYYTLHRGVEIVYLRGLMFGMLMLGIVAGAGLMGIRQIKLPEKMGGLTTPSWLTRLPGIILCLVLVGMTLSVAIPARQNASYYHMIDQVDYDTFAWIRDNVPAEYNRAILDPWKGTAFVAITGKNVYTRIHMAPAAPDNQAYAFLSNGASDTAFLQENGISLVYSREAVSNPDLVPVRQYVYLLKPEK